MKKILLIVIIGCLAISPLWAQNEEEKSFSNFPVIITIQFHSLALPFRNLPLNFSNIGIGIGTEVGLNKSNSVVQQVSALWYRNRTVGNGLLLLTQTALRPAPDADVFKEVKIGAGYTVAYRPSESFRQVDGKWVSAGYRGKGMLTIPAGVSVGYNHFSPDAYVVPLLTYQFMLVKNYNTSIPLMPQTLIQVGSMIYR